MILGETLWKMERPIEETERISKLLKDESSLNYRVFDEHCWGQKLFNDICKGMTRTITGFRPTSDLYRKRVRSTVLKDLRENKARPNFWLLYQTCVADYIVSELPSLNQLLGDTQLPEDFQLTTEGIFAEIANRALDYSVHDRDLEALYELWPFSRTPRISDYLSRCPKFDRFRAVDEKLRAVESRLRREIADLREHVAHEIDGIRSNLQSKVATKIQLEESIDASHREVERVTAPISQAVERIETEVSRVREIARRIEARWTAKQKKADLERAREFEEASQAIRQLRDEQLRLAETLDQVVSKATSVANPHEKARGSTGSPLALFQNTRRYSHPSTLTVENALEQFSQLTHQLDNVSGDDVRIFFYSALLGNCIVLTNRIDWSCWEEATGWPVRKMTNCASPLWVDEDAIGEQLWWLFDEPDEPRCLEILDFDLGYMDGYLSPLIRAWANSDQRSPWKKLLLVPSNTDWSVSHRLSEDLIVLPALFFEPSSNGGGPGEPTGMLAPSGVRQFAYEVGFASWPRDDASASDLREGGRRCMPRAPGLSQKQILRAMPLADTSREDFIRNLELLWSTKASH